MAITSGVYLVGENGDYADLEAALADIVSLTGDIDLVQISPYSISAGTTHDIDLNGHRLRITSAIPQKGKGAVGFETDISDSFSSGTSITIRLGGSLKGTVRLEHQYWTRSGSPTGQVDMLRFDQDATDKPPAFIEVVDCIFNGNDVAAANGINTCNEFDVRIWNSMFLNFPGTSHWGVKVGFNTYNVAQPTAYVDNCMFFGCYDGLYLRQPTQVTNSIAFDCSNEAFNISLPTTADPIVASNANVSDDGTALGFGGELNQQDEDIADEFQSIVPTNKLFAVPFDDSYLLRDGVPPAIEENSTGVEGNARPGSDNAYSIGPYEAQEKLRQAWSTQRKITVDGAKMTVTGSGLQICLTQDTPGMDSVLEAARMDGGDLRATTDRWGWDQLAIEVAQWSPDSGECMVWVRPTSTVAGEDFDLYLWYGNPNADHLPLDNDYGQWQVWENFTLVMHCLEDPDDGWVKDSSPGKHYGVFTGATTDTWQDGPAGVGRGYKLTSGVYVDLPSGDYVNGASGATTHAWVDRQAGNGGCLIEIRSPTTTERVQHEMLSSFGVQRFHARMPDGAGAIIDDSDTAVDTNPHQLGGGAENGSPDSIFHFLDGAADGPFSTTLGDFTNSDSSAARVGDTVAGGSSVDSIVQEMWVYKGVDRNDVDFFSTWYEMLANSVDFYKLPSFTNQDGARDIQFLTDEGEVQLAATDYYVTFVNNNDGTLAVTLNGVWEAIGVGQDWGLDRRLAVEARLRELARMQGTRGDLIIGPDRPQTIENVVLQQVTVEAVDNNAGIIYALQFGTAFVAAVARELVFNGQRIQASDFFVEYVATDRTQFKTVFRAAPIRIESGPPLKLVRITSMLALTGTARGRVASRRRVEAFVKDWAFQRLGTEGDLAIDGVSEGTCHLADVAVSDLTYPDRVGVDMTFVTGYGS